MSSREEAFTQRRRQDWDDLDRLVSRRNNNAEDIARMTALYRDVCADLLRAEGARYSAGLVDYLQGLTRSAHTAVYGAKARAWTLDFRSLLVAFPRALRVRWRALALAAALFLIPGAIMMIATLLHPELALRVLPESQLRPLADAYAEG